MHGSALGSLTSDDVQLFHHLSSARREALSLPTAHLEWHGTSSEPRCSWFAQPGLHERKARLAVFPFPFLHANANLAGLSLSSIRPGIE